MKVYFIQYELRPPAERKDAAAGAIAYCWVAAKDSSEARNLALRNVHSQGWRVRSVQSRAKSVSRSQYAGQRDILEYFDIARSEGACFVFHQWSDLKGREWPLVSTQLH